MKRPMHGANLKYAPFEFDNTNAEEIVAFLKAQNELLEMKGISRTIHTNEWLHGSMKTTCNLITGWSKWYGNMVTPCHNHTFYEINFVIKGKLVQLIEGKSYIMEKGDLLFMPPSVYHVCYPTKDSVCVNILFTCEFISEICTTLSNCIGPSNYLARLMKNPVYLLFKTGTYPQISETISEMFAICFGTKIFDTRLKNTFADNLSSQIIMRLTQCESSDYRYSPTAGTENSKDKIPRILQYIKDNCATVTMEDVCNTFGYSPQHIRRMIFKYTGQNFKFYLLSEKLSKADHFVKKTDYPIKDIAAMLGFTPEYFSRKYKYERGASPEKIREQARKQSEKPRKLTY